MILQSSQKRYLRGLAHSLEPALVVGRQGLSPSWLAELDAELGRHELVKVRMSSEREERQVEVATLVGETGAALVAQVGRIAVLYRSNPELDDPIELPRSR